MLEFAYKNGRGHISFNLETLLPCSAADFKRLMSFIELSEEPEENAGKVFDFIKVRVNELKKDREETAVESAKKRYTEDIKRYISNADQLCKVYHFESISDGEREKIILKQNTIYRMIVKNREKAITTETGWTFEKYGIKFGVYKEDKKPVYYQVIHLETGCSVGGAGTRKEAIERVDNKMIKAFQDNPEKIADFKKAFTSAMINAGFMDPEEKQEVERVYTFSKDTITYDGKTFPVEYRKSSSGSVLVFITTGTKENGRKTKEKLVIDKENEFFQAAAAAAGIETNTEKRRICEEPAAAADLPEEKPENEKNTENTRICRNTKEARGPVPEKTFIGTSITGNGWKIFFDGDKQRTRIIFEQKPTDAAKIILDKAGFYYSSVMNSWNKKLTFKAFRAANAISKELDLIYAA